MTKSAFPGVDSITLLHGTHDKRKEGVCAMEAVAWMAGEKHTDHPACVSTILVAFLRRWNDDLDDEGRYRMELPEGSYRVTLEHGLGIPPGVSPTHVITIRQGETTELDFEIDTGIR